MPPHDRDLRLTFSSSATAPGSRRRGGMHLALTPQDRLEEQSAFSRIRRGGSSRCRPSHSFRRSRGLRAPAGASHGIKKGKGNKSGRSSAVRDPSSPHWLFPFPGSIPRREGAASHDTGIADAPLSKRLLLVSLHFPKRSRRRDPPPRPASFLKALSRRRLPSPATSRSVWGVR